MEEKITTLGHIDNRLLAGLSAEARHSMIGNLGQNSFEQGATLYEPGDAIETIYFPQSGLISLVAVLEDGGTVEASIVGREGAVGLHRGLGPRSSLNRAVVQIAGKFSTISGDRFQHLMIAIPALHAMVVRHSELALAEVRQLVACNVAHDASARLARWLLMCADRIGSDTVPLTQEFLAQMLGVRRTTVTLLAQAFQRSGVIQYKRGRITIRNRTELSARACECYSIIRDDKLPLLLGLRS